MSNIRVIEGTPKRLPVAAVAIAVATLIVGGAAHRAIDYHLGRGGDTQPLPPGALAELPMQIGEWQGKDEPLDEAVIKVLDSDQHLSRLYSRRGEGVGLFISYGVRARDLMPHRPDVCYPGAGWTLENRKSAEVRLDDGSVVPCTVFTFNRGGLGWQRMVVLNYYIVDGSYGGDVSLLRSRAWRGQGGVKYMAQVQVTCPDNPASSRRAHDVTMEFAGSAAGPIRALLPDTADFAEGQK